MSCKNESLQSFIKAYRAKEADIPKKVRYSPYCELLIAAISNAIAIENLLQNLSPENYPSLLSIAQNVATSVGPEGRVVLALPDGKVVIDTAVGDLNTYENFQLGLVGSNHNTRAAFMDVQLNRGFVSYEEKVSSSAGTLNQRRQYVTLRLGKFRNNAGTIAVSNIAGLL